MEGFKKKEKKKKKVNLKPYPSKQGFGKESECPECLYNVLKENPHLG